ncbi:MAG: hypothetical protein CTY10_04965 [Methylotenera sp.]|nr:MAG: hypothetical protein CTY10_04965 [Methylotenera sp.]
MKFLLELALKVRNSGLNQGGDYGYISARDMSSTIPKVIHQTYHKKVLPREIQQNINHIKSINPDWEYRLYDDADIEVYIDTHYPQLLSIYKKINPIYGAAKADFFRYLVIYNDGGVYLDIKSTLTIPLNEVLLPSDSYLLSHWQNEPGQIHAHIGPQNGVNHIFGEFQQWHIVAAKGHPFLKSVIENVCDNIRKYNPYIHDTGHWGTLNLTGPIAYTAAILPKLDKYPHRVERDNSKYGFIYSFYESRGEGSAHKALSIKHYTLIDEPIVMLSATSDFLFNLIKPLYNYAKDFLRSLKK